MDWMNQTDDRILELLDESGLDLSPSVIAHNLDYSRSWISRRIDKLEDSGLVEADGTYYHISEKGRDYLAGDLTAEEI
ncbi:phage PhiH1 repressor protein [Halosimplex carlsbadense 2-9-1]|uniref:Phage PhiH1 repressor protein n=1 Tax=Halosimplex carlsbadense 2-9-1 TaxID=797114 RepID=M0D562_9EURY|nr:phage PhiH1 repressor protein [Halosimplex carlsbadense 2-9-1]